MILESADAEAGLKGVSTGLFQQQVLRISPTLVFQSLM